MRIGYRYTSALSVRNLPVEAENEPTSSDNDPRTLSVIRGVLTLNPPISHVPVRMTLIGVESCHGMHQAKPPCLR